VLESFELESEALCSAGFLVVRRFGAALVSAAASDFGADSDSAFTDALVTRRARRTGLSSWISSMWLLLISLRRFAGFGNLKKDAVAGCLAA
jgi:hypothetical protein